MISKNVLLDQVADDATAEILVQPAPTVAGSTGAFDGLLRELILELHTCNACDFVFVSKDTIPISKAKKT